ncbi:MAG: hypothetical protein MK081_08880 [Flavobacteriales bacterium]|nr:hypothetical protein [Flavobacteriales bacterium]
MKRTHILGLIFLLFCQNIDAQQSPAEGVAFLLPYFEQELNEKEMTQIEGYLDSPDTLHQLMAISLLFRADTASYREQMMDMFEIPYKNWKFRRGKMTCPTREEKAIIDRQISLDLKNTYKLRDKDLGGIAMLYTFIVYRANNVWQWQTDSFAIPITTATRGGYLNWLFADMLEFKKQFISDMQERTKARSKSEENQGQISE